jgi:hypothetical protein
VEDFSVKWGLGIRGRCSRSTWVTWPHQNWGIPFFMASLSYLAPQFGESTGLCATRAWSSPSRTGHPGPNCGTQAALISASHPDYLISGCGTSRLTRVNEVTWRHRHLLIWHLFFSGLQGTLNHRKWRFEEINLIHQCFLTFINIGTDER